MIGPTLITITEDPAGVKYYAYELRPGDVYHIAHRWISNCDLDIPRPGTVFHFGGRRLIAIGEDVRCGQIRAIDAQPFWRARYQLRMFRAWIHRKRRRITWQFLQRKKR